MSATELVLLGVAAFVAGAVNTVAGGGSLLSFPALLAVGLDPLSANVTNTVGLTPGYLGGVLAYRAELAPQRRRAWLLSGTVAVGAVAGSAILLLTPQEVFEAVVPFLVLGACLLLLLQPRVGAWLRHRDAGRTRPRWGLLHAVAFVGGVYGAYFGAALGVMLLALLGVLLLREGLQRVNALKALFSLVSAVVATVIFVGFSGRVDWVAAAVLAGASLVGGRLGGLLARRLSDRALRICVVVVGVAVSARLLVG